MADSIERVIPVSHSAAPRLADCSIRRQVQQPMQRNASPIHRDKTSKWHMPAIFANVRVICIRRNTDSGLQQHTAPQRM